MGGEKSKRRPSRLFPLIFPFRKRDEGTWAIAIFAEIVCISPCRLTEKREKNWMRELDESLATVFFADQSVLTGNLVAV